VEPLIRSTEALRARFPNPNTRAQVIVSPYQMPIGDEDSFRLNAAANGSGVIISADYRWLSPDGTIQVNSRTLSVPATRTVAEAEFRTGEGYLLSVVIRTTGELAPFTLCYVSLELIRGFTGARIVMGQIIGGYVTNRHGLAWPGTPIIDSLEGPGVSVGAAVGSSPAGTEPTLVVPLGAFYRVHSLVSSFVAGAAAANRFLYAQKIGNADISWLIANLTPMTANQGGTATWAPGLPLNSVNYSAGGYVQTNGLPEQVPLRPGEFITLGALNMQAADQFARADFEYTEWLQVTL